MSVGAPIPYEAAMEAAAVLAARWRFSPSVAFVGSLRRQEKVVHDLDVVAPRADKASDQLYIAIDESLERPGALFGAEGPAALGVSVRGHRRGFLAASYRLTFPTTPPVAMGVNVSRYTEDNRGWQMIYRTGPRCFGMAFLVAWKKRFDIAKGGHALVEDHLRDDRGIVVPVPDEETAFALCGMKWVVPPQRDAVGRHLCMAMNISLEE